MKGYSARSRNGATFSTWLVVVALTLLVVAARTSAQSAQETALARTLFEEGVTMADRGDWQGAADRFGRAFALKPTSGIAFNYASALVNVGRLVEASELLRSVSRDPTASAELRQGSEAKLAEITPRIGYLTVRLASDPGPEARIDIDDHDWPRAAWGIASPIDPGSHVIRLSRTGVELDREELALADGERREVILEPMKPAEPPPPVGPVTPQTKPNDPGTATKDPGHLGEGPSERRPLYKSWVVWTAVGAVVIGGVVAGVLLASGGDEKTEAPVQGDANPAVWRW